MWNSAKTGIYKCSPRLSFPGVHDALQECLLDFQQGLETLIYGENLPGREEREAKAIVTRHIQNSAPIALSLVLGLTGTYLSLVCSHHWWPSLLQICFHRAHRITCVIMGAWGTAGFLGFVHVHQIMIRCSGSLNHWACRRTAAYAGIVFGSIAFMPVALHFSVWHVGVSIPLVVNNLIFCMGCTKLNKEVRCIRYILLKSWVRRFLPRTQLQYVLDQIGQRVDKVSFAITGHKVAGHAIVATCAAKTLESFSYLWLVWTPFIAQKF